MLAFVDESGCPGLKLGMGSTPFFTVAVVLFAGAAQAADAEKRIAQVRRDLRFRRDHEFHFNNLRAEYRETFVRAMAGAEFTYYAATINKAALAPGQIAPGDPIYRQTCALAFEAARTALCRTTIVMDRHGSKAFQRELSSFLRQQLQDASGESLIRSVKAQNPERNDLLQLADAVCGSVAQ